MRALLLLLLLSIALDASANEAPRCAQSRSRAAEEIVRIGQNAWVTNLGTQLFLLVDDHIQNVIDHPDSFLELACGVDGQLVAFSEGKSIYRLHGGNLDHIDLTFPGSVIYVDGESVYSMDYPGDGNTGAHYYVTTGGKTSELSGKALGAGVARGGYFVQIVKGGYLLYKNGKLARRVVNPSVFHPGMGPGYSDFAACGTDGIFWGRHENEFWLRSKYGLARFVHDDNIRRVDFPQGCANYYLLTDLGEPAKGTLLRFAPGKRLARSVVPTSCSVGSFVLNPDESLYFRCEGKFFYKPAKEGNEIFLGEIKGPVNDQGIDKWLATGDQGVFYSYASAKSASDPQTTCFARLLPDRVISMGCREVPLQR